MVWIGQLANILCLLSAKVPTKREIWLELGSGVGFKEH